jgi:hypothetical protein
MRECNGTNTRKKGRLCRRRVHQKQLWQPGLEPGTLSVLDSRDNQLHHRHSLPVLHALLYIYIAKITMAISYPSFLDALCSCCVKRI